MKRYDLLTPEGTRDLLFEESLARREAEGMLSDLFVGRGFSEVMTPGMEFYDVFHADTMAIPAESMYKFADAKGRLLVMRPDSTMPIARLVATRMQNARLPIRLYYAQDVYRFHHGLSGHYDQMFQAGVELIGAAGERADLEVLALAADALAESGCGDFRLEIGHVGFFQSLMRQLPADGETKDAIRTLIENKNYAGLSDELDALPPSQTVDVLRRLPRLFGGEEVFGKAYELFSENGALECLDYLHGLYEDLRQLGLEDRVIIDLGLVNQAEYYTGLIFRGYFDGIGEPVLSGGRYDNLLGEFGAPLSATGFAVNIDPAAQVVGEPAPQTPDILVFSDERHLPEAVNYIKSLTENGLVAENCVYDDFDAAADYARRRGIRQLHVVDDAIEVVDVETLKGEGAR